MGGAAWPATGATDLACSLCGVRAEGHHQSGYPVSPKGFWMPQGLPKRVADGRWDLSPAKEAKFGEAPELLP